MWSDSGFTGRSAGSVSSRPCQATSPSRTSSGRSRATNKRARGLLRRSLATAQRYPPTVTHRWTARPHSGLSGRAALLSPAPSLIDSRAVERALPEVPGVEHRFVNAGGLRTHVAEAGSGPPLLLLHGWPQHWWMWRKLIRPLAESHRVICPDLRGFGWTEAPPGGYDPEVFANDLIALLDALGIDGAGRPRRARLGRLDRLHALPPAPRADPSLPRSQHLPPFHPAVSTRVPRDLALLVPVGSGDAGYRPPGDQGGRASRSRSSAGSAPARRRGPRRSFGPTPISSASPSAPRPPPCSTATPSSVSRRR